jgi:AcrR family transcriptional regulator
MRDIYEEAQLSPGAVYHYFEGKDEIIQASFDFDFQRSLDLFNAARESQDPLQALDDLTAFLFQGLKGAAPLGAGRVNVQGWGEALVNPRLGEGITRLLDSYLETMAHIIRRAQALGQFDRSLDPLAASQILASLYYGLELQKALDPNLDIDQYAAAVKVLLFNAKRSRSAAQPVNRKVTR